VTEVVRKDPWFRNRLIRDGIMRAICEEMRSRPEIYLLGEGAHMKVHFDAPDIEANFPERVLTLPISEDGNSNFAVGMSLAGVVPIVDVISSDFLYRTMDAICNTMAKAETVSSPRTMVVRSEFLTGGPTSGQRIEALFAHVPGLRVVVPSTPADAYGLMLEALRIPAVTIFFEDRMISDEGTPARYLPSVSPPDVGFARIAKEGDGVVVVSYGITCRRAEEALADTDAAILDLRSLWPLDITTVAAFCVGSVDNALLVVEPDVGFLGIGAEVVASMAERWPGIAVSRLGAGRKTIPASRELHDRAIPSAAEIRVAHDALKERSS
jgi:pyruvate/2-oxoglutarate/acetoin dehydrogenase E1 component